ncbi:short chain enoyl-CoA hydratase /3-hydroxyacyl-CoA dehydrogenase [Brevibacterium sanguinis]|uniref:Short chain enoyl-CoA hydratase /3-hydroxyacyl-CoA dehydrogenase n=2 Tax=Brevibacterium TaxID=1696 RepID=A0A366IEM5_9MICO|nr:MULTISPECIES: 3-hydroxyacyl-CoA dehydrogenase NAD-binding domain-containing protein [Brevibacterium]RBP63082.1 short chain enoyl-CoA hydratase /3-hydroxyacyl-CoA dehydrogenase [Brevibacterium sanguinis]RBP69742.1 short chain enoyl-CoA hydratase /3-hydroxyacyl-CoA dehydrogenase [Brevibacterium celere]
MTNDNSDHATTDRPTTPAQAASYARRIDPEGVVTIVIDDPDSSVNTMNDHFSAALEDTVGWLESSIGDIRGVILTSAKPTFFAGGDLTRIRAADPDDAAAETAQVDHIKGLLRRLETLGRPVVAALGGTALGGGLEVALAAHHRIAAEDVAGARFGFPEVSLGLLPGGGGIARTVRMIGLQDALQKAILPATKFRAAEARELGLIDELAPLSELEDRARIWIRDNPDAVQPWDAPGFRIPGGSPSSPALASMLPALPALLRRQLKGAPMPAPRAALAAAVEGAGVDIDTALSIETRYFVHLTHTAVAKNMIKAFFFDLGHIDSGGSRPADHEPRQVTRLGVLGAGMMGAAIAYTAAKAGIEVVLKDVDLATAERGRDYARKREESALAKGRTTSATSEAVLGRITPTDKAADFAGVDFVVEAVVESVPVKQQVFAEIEDIVAPDAILGSNTSTLPITELATGTARAADFIGVHFFSPADKMPLVEIIRGEETSDETLARTFDFVRQIRKTPIVVGDSRGFFTSRVIGTFIAEAVAAVGEGVEPASVEQAALQAGYPAGALQLLDELTLTLSQRIRKETRTSTEAAGGTWDEHPSEAVIDWMIEQGRTGRRDGAGFYDYDETGRRGRLWPGLRERYGADSARPMARQEFVDLQERMLFAEALETIRCLDEGVLTSVPDANIGSIYGIGFPAWTGGVLQYVNQYEGGLSGFVGRANELAAAYGDRFAPPESLIERARTGATFD